MVCALGQVDAKGLPAAQVVGEITIELCGTNDMSDLLSLDDCIAVLTSTEGDTVTFLCEDPECYSAAERFAVDVNGDWTNFEDVRYTDASHLLAARKAARQKRIIEG